jgi:cell wall-associated NlpC family hydrolase
VIFFDNEEGNIIHVGIIMENNYIIHASGKLELTVLTTLGLQSEINKRTNLRVIKKII